MPQTELNLLINADVYNCVDCIHDSRLGYYVSWAENNNLNGYDSYSGITAVTTWDGIYFAVSSNTSCYLGSSTVLSIDASAYTIIKISLRIDLGHHTVVPTTGKISFRTSS